MMLMLMPMLVVVLEIVIMALSSCFTVIVDASRRRPRPAALAMIVGTRNVERAAGEALQVVGADAEAGPDPHAGQPGPSAGVFPQPGAGVRDAAPDPEGPGRLGDCQQRERPRRAGHRSTLAGEQPQLAGATGRPPRPRMPGRRVHLVWGRRRG
jgi:hypothetical protein